MSWSVEDALNEFHDRYASAASRVFGGAPMSDGHTSYLWLAQQAAAADTRALDLGCGDGFLLERLRELAPHLRLTGVDMNRAELDQAARRFPSGDVDLVCARAQALPLADGTQDLVVSHMAVMLMDELDRVVAEVARVLRPGGRFAVVVGRGGDADELQRAFYQRLREVSGVEPRRIAWPSDERIHSVEGITALFAGWSDLTVRDAMMHVHVERAGLWAYLQIAYYGVGLLSDEGADALRAFVECDLVAAAPPGPVRWGIPIRLVTARRA